MFTATFNNISVILWQSVLLLDETGVPIENQHSIGNIPYQILRFTSKVRSFMEYCFKSILSLKLLNQKVYKINMCTFINVYYSAVGIK